MQLELFGPSSSAGGHLGEKRSSSERRSRGGSLAQAHAFIETYLRSLVGPKLVIKLTNNRSTMISFQWRRSVLYLRLHRSFASAPPPVLTAVAAFCGIGRLTRGRSQLLDAYMDEAGAAPDRTPDIAVQPRGAVHDLARILHDLNRRFFEDRIDARITWGASRSTSNRKRSIRLGTYVADLKLIRIHPALDQSFVPEFYVASIVFHEMLHQVHPITRSRSGRRQIHSPAFLRDERRFPDYARARTWERQNIHRLLQT
ncbi:MAG: hypothetical protein ACFB9M_02410 [Myxococcota bacterium]